MVSSTTPSPAPMWPPVREQTSISRARTSSASVAKLVAAQRAEVGGRRDAIEDDHG